MRAKIPLTFAVAVALLWGASALALGFGRAPAAVVLGSPLNFALSLRLDAGETLEAECLSAEVYYGDRRLAPFNVRVLLEPGADSHERVARVTSAIAVDEPVVSVSITAGCVTKTTRRLTAFADPPLGSALAPAAPPMLPAADTSGAREGAAAPAATATLGTGGSTAALAPSGPISPPGPAPAASAPLRSAPLNSAQSANKAVTAKARKKPAAQAKSAKGQAPIAAARVRPAPLPASAPAPALADQGRLKLDVAEAPSTSAAAVAASAATEALANALRAANAAEDAASSAGQRIKSLEQQVDRLLAEARQQREQVQDLRGHMAQTQSQQGLLPWLVGLLALIAAVAVWLGLQVRKLRTERQQRWWADAPASVAPAAAVHASVPVAEQGAAAVAAAAIRPSTLQAFHQADSEVNSSLLDVPASPPATPQPTVVSPVTISKTDTQPGMTTAPVSRAMSVEELIDLEQQADFFVVLGQDESAVDLLVGHIRGTGGTSPLPYLKLLEIDRRRGDRDAYDRTRARFNQRFNAYAPDWDTDMQQGRSLEDYAQVMDGLSQAWDKPLDAMAQLETLLFRKDGGELFELPAYRDVLMLYSLARDLLDQQGGANSQSVDVLLPLGSTPFETTAARPHLSLDLAETERAGVRTDFGQPTLALDLDLSDLPPPAPQVAHPAEFADSAYSDSDFGLDSRYAEPTVDLRRAPRKK